MSGSLVYLGSLSVAQWFPALATVDSNFKATVGLTRPKVAAQLAGMAKFTATPPKVTAGVNAALAAKAQLSAKIARGKFVTVDVNLISGIVAKLNAKLGQLNGYGSYAAQLAVAFGTSGIDSYAYSGPVAALGPALNGALASGFPSGGGSTAAVNSLVIATQSTPAVAALYALASSTFDKLLKYLGSKSLGQVFPTGLSASGSLAAAVSASLPQITAQIAAYLNIGVGIGLHPPDINAMLVAALAVKLGITPPTVAFSAGLTANLTASLASLSVQLGLPPLNVGGFHLYRYTGDAGSLGGAVASQFAGGLPNGGGNNADCSAMMLATQVPAAWAAMVSLLKTT